MAIDLAVQFLPYTDELFATESKKALITNNDLSWSGAHTVKVYSVTTSNMNDYNRSGADDGHWSRYGAVEGLDATTQEFTLRRDRSFTFAIDRLDEDETKRQLAAASALARQLREVIVPEVDTWAYSQMCENAGQIGTPEVLTADNVYEMIIKANSELDNAEVPETNRSLLVTPDVYLLLKKDRDIILETDIGNDLRLKGVISVLDGLNVLKIPANRLPDDFGFMVVHPVATVAPVKLEAYKVHQDPPGISGSLVEGRINYDAFVLKNKANAIYYHAQA